MSEYYSIPTGGVNDAEIIGDGQGIRWPDIDEDLSAEGMLHGIPAHKPKR